jgi:transposase
VISGIVHILRTGCRWCDCPPEYGPPTTIYNRFVRWARRGIWENLFRDIAGAGRCSDIQMIDSTHVKAHRSAAGGKGGSKNRLLAAREEAATRRSMRSQMLRPHPLRSAQPGAPYRVCHQPASHPIGRPSPCGQRRHPWRGQPRRSPSARAPRSTEKMGAAA